jgi:Mrp family chromosome partitioning ATPase
VLLIEADLRRPRLAEMLGVRPDRGLRRMLESDASFNGRPVEDIFSVPVSGADTNGDGAAAQNGGGKRLDVLPAGEATDEAGALLDSDRMRDLLEWAYERYDFIVIDGPPPTLVSDAIPLMKLVDGVVVVGRLGRDSDPELRELREEMERFSVTPVGAVATFSRRVANPYSAKKG